MRSASYAAGSRQTDHSEAGGAIACQAAFSAITSVLRVEAAWPTFSISTGWPRCWTVPERRGPGPTIETGIRPYGGPRPLLGAKQS
jgi:hypothetical protein